MAKSPDGGGVPIPTPEERERIAQLRKSRTDPPKRTAEQIAEQVAVVQNAEAKWQAGRGKK